MGWKLRWPSDAVLMMLCRWDLRMCFMADLHPMMMMMVVVVVVVIVMMRSSMRWVYIKRKVRKY